MLDPGWALKPATEADYKAVMTWFADAPSVRIWGGPDFRYPFTAESFREDCRIDQVDSYCLFDPHGEIAAFGQSYMRDGRGHLARLVSNPELRRNGVGRRLISMIIAALDAEHGYDEYSLFVYRHNIPAYKCYLSLGFVRQEYPADAPMRDECYFLTKPRSKS